MAKWIPMLNGNPAARTAYFVADPDFAINMQFDNGTGLDPTDANFAEFEAVAKAKLATLTGDADAMAVVGIPTNSFCVATGTHTYTR